MPYRSLCHMLLLHMFSIYAAQAARNLKCSIYFSLRFDNLSPQWGLFDRTFGRADAQEADPEGRVPDWSKASVQEMKDRFVAVGLGPRQVTTTSLLDR
jgi:hypothetical protein